MHVLFDCVLYIYSINIDKDIWPDADCTTYRSMLSRSTNWDKNIGMLWIQ